MEKGSHVLREPEARDILELEKEGRLEEALHALVEHCLFALSRGDIYIAEALVPEIWSVSQQLVDRKRYPEELTGNEKVAIAEELIASEAAEISDSDSGLQRKLQEVLSKGLRVRGRKPKVSERKTFV
ncbi:MAG: hypothetical protein ACE5JU_25655 [Candidatus Binatia bacterium]